MAHEDEALVPAILENEVAILLCGYEVPDGVVDDVVRNGRSSSRSFSQFKRADQGEVFCLWFCFAVIGARIEVVRDRVVDFFR